jgi:hypothetical protein
MSSHHFVKEGQEPALILVDAVSADYVSDLQEWAPTIIILPDAIDFILEKGTKVDVVITDEHHAHHEAFRHQEPVRFFHSENKRKALETALSLLSEEKQTSVNIVCADAQEMIQLITAFTSSLEINILSQDKKYSHHTRGILKKWFAPGHDFEIMSDSEVTVAGWVNQSDKYVQILEKGVVEISSAAGFWLIEKID